MAKNEQSKPEEEARVEKPTPHPAPRQKISRLGGQEEFHMPKSAVDKINEIVDHLNAGK